MQKMYSFSGLSPTRSPFRSNRMNKFSCSIISESPHQPRGRKIENEFNNLGSCVSSPIQDKQIFLSQQILNGGHSLEKAPLVVDRTPIKKRIHSPCQEDLEDKGNAKRYRTKTPRGSIIHSNFKINQNSLQKIAGSTAEKRNGPPTPGDSNCGVPYTDRKFSAAKELKFDSQIYGNNRNQFMMPPIGLSFGGFHHKTSSKKKRKRTEQQFGYSVPFPSMIKVGDSSSSQSMIYNSRKKSKV